MTYMCGNPKQTVTRQTTEGDATAGQNYIPIPGGLIPGSCDVFVGGSNLSSAAPNPDYSDADGMGIALTTPMQAGTRFRVVVTLRTSGHIQQVSRNVTEGQATQGQTVIPIPGGYPPSQNMVDVAVNGYDLSVGDFDDSSGTQIVVAKAMNAGMQFRVVSYANYMNVAPVSGQLAGFRNRLINGDMRVNQYASSVSVTGGKTYGPYDRWAGNASSSGAFTSQFLAVTFSGITRAALQALVTTVPSLGTTLFWTPFFQILEGFNTYDLVNSPITLSFIFQSNVVGTYSCALQDSNSQSCVMTFNYLAAGVPQKVALTFPAPTTPLSILDNGSAGLTMRIASYTASPGNIVAPGAWQSNISGIVASGCVNWTAAVNNYVAVAEVQLEVGANATLFERRPIMFELAQCQRYYCKSYAYGIYAGANTGIAQGIIDATGSTVNSSIATVRFPVEMRTQPTIVVYDGTGAAGLVSVDGVSAGTSSGISID